MDNIKIMLFDLVQDICKIVAIYSEQNEGEKAIKFFKIATDIYDYANEIN